MEKVVIIGAGLTGLSCAVELKRMGIDFIILEKSSRVGGAIKTYQDGEFCYESGPNTGSLNNIYIHRLFNTLGDRCKLELANEDANIRYILKNGKWESLPSGFKSAVTTPLFSMKDKLRVLGEPFRKKGNNPNETLSSLVERRLGKSFLDYAIDPFIAGVYAGNVDYLVPKYALPKLYNLEQNYGSFVKGAIQKSKEPKTEEEKQVKKEVFSVEGGLENLTKSMLDYIGAEHVVYNCMDLSIRGERNDRYVQYNNDVKLPFSQVFVSVGSYELPNIFNLLDPTTLGQMNNATYAPVVEVTLGFDSWTGLNLEGFGGLIPSKEKRKILGVLFMSSFLKNRAPKGGKLLTIFAGGMRNPEIFESTDEEIRAIIQSEIFELFGLNSFEPKLFRIHRHKYAIPQYGANTKIRQETLKALKRVFPNIIIGGNSVDGIGMGDRIQQGYVVAQEIKSKI